MGLGAQTVERYATSCGISLDELAAVDHSYFSLDENGRTDRYGLAYEEIHMLTMAQCQINTKDIGVIKSDIEKLQEQLKEAQNKISELEKQSKALN